MARKIFVLAIAAFLWGGAVHAGTFDLAFNNDDFDTWLTFDLGKGDDARFLIGGRYLYSSSSEDDASIPAFVIGFNGQPSASDEFRFFVGAQGYLGDAQNEDVRGIGVGGNLTWTPENWKGIFIGARLFYAPEVFCFGDTTGIFEWAGRGGYQINEKFQVFLQYSKLNADIDTGSVSGDLDVDTGLTIGAGIRF